MGPGVLLSGRGGAPERPGGALGRPGGASYRWASAIYRIKMVLTRASGTVMASSLNQNKFWTKYCCTGGIKPAPSPLGRWRKNDTIIGCLDGIFIEIFCVWGNGLDPFPHLEAPGEEVQQ